MKAITCPVILTSASTRVDGSLSLRFSTPELDAASKTAFFELLNLNLKILIQPGEEQPDSLHDIKQEGETKTPSQRLRNTIFVLWQQRNSPGEFDDFYKRKMSFILASIKAELTPP